MDKDKDINTNEEYVPIEELDQLEDAEGNPVTPLYGDVTNTDDALDTTSDESNEEDSIGSEEDSENRGGDAKTDLRRGIQGGGDDRNDE
jgi:hypothetical protein